MDRYQNRAVKILSQLAKDTMSKQKPVEDAVIQFNQEIKNVEKINSKFEENRKSLLSFLRGKSQ